MQTPLAEPSRPPIFLSEAEADALSTLATSPAHRSRAASRMLLEEIDRAEIRDWSSLPADVVTMMSHVSFVDEASGAAHQVQLVYPGSADSDAHRISILTPLGAGLIGLREGESIDWPDRSGHLRRLTIVRVVREIQAAA